MVEPLTKIPLTTGEVAPELESEKIELLFAVLVVPPVNEIPDTDEEAPVEDRLLTEFAAKVWMPELVVIPVTAPPPEILATVLLETSADPEKLTANAVAALVPQVQLENVFPVIVFIGEPPSVVAQPAIVVAPVRVMFEKLLLLLISVMVGPEVEFDVYKVTVPPAPVLLKPVTIELLFTVPVPLVGLAQLLAMNVKLPVVLVVRFVKVLLLIL